MNWKTSLKIGITALIFSSSLWAARTLEGLDRGLVAVYTGGTKVFVSWRYQGTESRDLGFNLYRDGVKLNNSPLTTTTNYEDKSGSANASYVVKTVKDGVEISESKSVKPWGEITKRVPLQSPGSIYSPNDGSAGDLDGDGDWDLVLKWDPNNSQDNSKSGKTGNVFLDGMSLDGERFWRIDLGVNIRAGAHYTQFVVADFDLDGKAEVICKTAPGTKDGKGKLISKGPAASAIHDKDYRNSGGYVLDGPEYLTVFSGVDGSELATVNYNPARGSVASWGDTYGNRVDRFLATAAWLDGNKPSAVMQRGYYTRMALTAYDWDGKTLSQRWYHNSATSGKDCYGQGNHNLSVGDVDNDGKDEILQGSCAIDHDGKTMYRTGLGHGDAIHFGDLDPNRPGLEVFEVHEDKGVAYGYEMHDAATGKILWGTKTGTDNGRGMSADIDASTPGSESWSPGDANIFTANGTRTSNGRSSVNFRIYWDGDLQDELLDGIGSAPSAMGISSWKNGRLVSTDNRYGNYVGINNNSTKANPVLTADLFGDWREEMILRQSDNSALIIYTTTIPSSYKTYTLMHDPVYRTAISWQNTSYNQPPHLGFFLGNGVEKAPVPDIQLTAGGVITEPVNRDCNGVIDGTAKLDMCGVCIAEGSNIKACTALIEAESVCSPSNLIIESNNGGFSGTGYVNTDNAMDMEASWILNSTENAKVSITIAYANGGTSARSGNILLDDVATGSSFTFAPTDSWTNWKTETVQLDLKKGSNKLTIKATTADGLANLDKIHLSDSQVSDGKCVYTPVAILPQMPNSKNLKSTGHYYSIDGRIFPESEMNSKSLHPMIFQAIESSSEEK